MKRAVLGKNILIHGRDFRTSKPTLKLLKGTFASRQYPDDITVA